jgi:hypothetical protein
MRISFILFYYFPPGREREYIASPWILSCTKKYRQNVNNTIAVEYIALTFFFTYINMRSATLLYYTYSKYEKFSHVKKTLSELFDIAAWFEGQPTSLHC